MAELRRINPNRYDNDFFQTPRIVANNCSDKGARLYAELKLYAGKDGKCYPSQKMLTDRMGISRQYLTTLTTELVNKYLIQVEYATAKERARGKRNTYHFLDYKSIYNVNDNVKQVNHSLHEHVNHSLPVYKVKESYVKELPSGSNSACKQAEDNNESISAKEDKEMQSSP